MKIGGARYTKVRTILRKIRYVCGPCGASMYVGRVVSVQHCAIWCVHAEVHGNTGCVHVCSVHACRARLLAQVTRFHRYRFYSVCAVHSTFFVHHQEIAMGWFL